MDSWGKFSYDFEGTLRGTFINHFFCDYLNYVNFSHFRIIENFSEDFNFQVFLTEFLNELDDSLEEAIIGKESMEKVLDEY